MSGRALALSALVSLSALTGYCVFQTDDLAGSMQVAPRTVAESESKMPEWVAVVDRVAPAIPLAAPAVTVDLARIAAAVHLLRASIGLLAGKFELDGSVRANDGTFADCSRAGTAMRVPGVPRSSVFTPMGCQSALSADLTYSAGADAGTTIVTGDSLSASGLLLGMTEGFTVEGVAHITPNNNTTTGLVGCDCREFTVQFASGATYAVDRAVVDGFMIASGYDMRYAGRFTAAFTYQGRRHEIARSGRLHWDPSFGFTAGTFSASSLDGNGTPSTYDVSFEPDGMISIKRPGVDATTRVQWRSIEFQQALLAALGP